MFKPIINSGYLLNQTVAERAREENLHFNVRGGAGVPITLKHNKQKKSGYNEERTRPS